MQATRIDNSFPTARSIINHHGGRKAASKPEVIAQIDAALKGPKNPGFHNSPIAGDIPEGSTKVLIG